MSTLEGQLARSLRELGQLSVLDFTLPEMLERIVVIANDTVKGSRMAGLTLDVAGVASTAAYTDEKVPDIDEAQNGPVGRGPCVDAARHGQTFMIPSTSDDERWKAFSDSCVAHGVQSTVSAPIIPRSAKRAALNLYADTVDAFDAGDVELVEAFAMQAALAIENAEAYFSAKQLADQLQIALDTRVVIEQAKGLLMAQGRSGDEAFEVLRTRSQHDNRKLRDIASDVVAEAEERAKTR